MGLFWDLIQQGQISKQSQHARSLEDRVRNLEDQMAKQQHLVLDLLQILEEKLDEDLDGDGRIGCEIWTSGSGSDF